MSPGFFGFLRAVAARSGAELRKHPRIKSSLRISYQIGTGPMCSDCRSKNISEGGIRIGLYQTLAAGSTLKLFIYFQGSAEPACIFGKIAWTRETPGDAYPREAGIAFDLFDPSLRAKIKDYLGSISAETK